MPASDYRVVDGRTQKRVGNMWSTITDAAAKHIKHKYGIGADNVVADSRNYIEQMRDSSKSAPKASQEVMDIRNATRPTQYGGPVPSPAGDAYNAMSSEQKKQFQHADATGQDRIAKSLVPQPPKTVQPPRTAISSTSVPRSNVPTPYGQLSPNQINTEAQNRLDRERAALKTSAEQRMAALRNSADYANNLIKDTRTLEDFRLSNSVNPFTTGKQTWDKGLVGRQRSIDDTYRADNLESELNEVQEDLYNFDKLAPERQQALINEMTRLERQYGLEVGNLTGNFNGQRTLAGQTADRNYGLGLAGLSGQLPGGGQTLASRNQEFNQGMAQQEFDFQQQQAEIDNVFRQQQFDYAKAADLWERTFKEKSFDQSVKEAAANRGLDWSRLNQQQQQFIAESAFREKQLGLDQERLDFQKQQDADESNNDFFSEITGLTTGIQNGQIDYNGALNEIQYGNYSPEQKEQLLQAAKETTVKTLLSQYVSSIQQESVDPMQVLVDIRSKENIGTIAPEIANAVVAEINRLFPNTEAAKEAKRQQDYISNIPRG